MSKKGKGKTEKAKKFDFQQKETQSLANNLLEKVTLDMKEQLPDVYWTMRSQEDQNDRGVDMEYELINRTTRETIFIFKLQIKGSRDELSPLTTTNNKGLISFPVEVKSARYYLYQINVPLLFIVCDTSKRIVYWHPIQLDESVEDKIRAADKKKKASLQIYIDPRNNLSGSTVDRFLKDMKESADEQYPRFNQYLRHPIFTATDQIIIDKSKHLFEQLHGALTQYFEQFSHIPPRDLLKLYPFRLKEGGYSNYDGFTATVESEELVKLLDLIKDAEHITDTEIIRIPDYQEKAKVITNTLFFNGIEFITSRNTRQKISLEPGRGGADICDCCFCAFTRFDFALAFKNSFMLEADDSLDLGIKKGYIQYKLCNYTQACKHYLAISKRARKEKKWIVYAICMYSIKNLKSFVKSYSWEQPDQQTVLNSIQDIDFEQEFSKVSSKQFFGQKLISWITNEKFYSQAFATISNIVKAIENHYYSQIDGGWSNNPNAAKLLSELFQITSLLNRNFIVFDQYRDFDEVFELAVKGYTASYAMHPSQSRLIHFNANVVQQMLVYSKPDFLITYFNRFRPKPFSTSSDQQLFLYTRLVNLLNSYKGIAELPAPARKDMLQFSRNRQEIFENALVLLALFEMPDAQYQELLDMIISTHRQFPVIDSQSLPYFKYFLATKGKSLNASQYVILLELSVKDPVFHDHNYIDVLTDQIKNHYPEIMFPTELMELLLDVYSDQCPSCKYGHQKEIIIFYWFISYPANKAIIEQKVLTDLRNRFEPGFYYMAAVFNVIDHRLFLDDFMLYATPAKHKRDFPSIFANSDSVFFSPIDKLVNLLYLFGYDLSEQRFDKFRNFSTYYRWLFHLAGFDYAEFEPMWLLNHASSIYLDRMKTILPLKLALKSFLKKNNSPALTKIYLDYFDNVS